MTTKACVSARCRNLYDRISTFIGQANALRENPLREVGTPDEDLPRQDHMLGTEQSLVANVGKMETDCGIPDELRSSPAEKNLVKAYELAKKGEAKSLPKVLRQLQRVQKYMFQKGLTC